MDKKASFDFWYAVKHTEVVLPPSRALETFGATRINYHLVSEFIDNPGKIRIREGRLEAHRPTIVTPDAYWQDELQGFGEEARKYYDFLKEHEDSIRILKYGYTLKQESFSEQTVTDSLEAVLERVVKNVRDSEDIFSTVIKGVDDPWDVCLVRFFWMHVNASAPVNIHQIEEARARELAKSSPAAIHAEVEKAFVRAADDPSLIRELGALLRRKGVFEQYQDRFFSLVRGRA